jgi:serine/threonine protein kinase
MGEMDSVPDTLRLLPGTRFNNYQVERLLGYGGMGAAFLARDTILGRPVVVKVMLGDAADDPTLLERFRREAQAGALIDSENVVKVYKAGRISGTPSLPLQGKPFIAMQYVDGGTVGDIATSHGRLPADLVAAITLGMARGLVATHAAGIVHRDVKPANALLTRDGRLKLADLGLAKFLRGINGGPPPPDLTRPGMTVGTAAYIAPEQAKGEAVDGRADVYALGATFYELLTSTLPFEGTSYLDTMALRFSEDPRPPRALVPDLPPAVERVCLALMARDPQRRPDASEAVGMLASLVPGDPSHALARLFADPKASTHLELVSTVARRYGLVRKPDGVLPDDVVTLPAPVVAAPHSAAPAAGRQLLPAALFALGSFFLATAAIVVALIVVRAPPPLATAPPVVPATRETAPSILKTAILSRRASSVRLAADALRAAPPFADSAKLIDAARDAELLVGVLEARGLDATLPLERLLDALPASGDDVKAAATLLAAVAGQRVPGALLLPAEARSGPADELARTLAALQLERPAAR